MALYKTIFYVDDDSDDLELFKIAVEKADDELSLFSMPDEMLLAMNNPPPTPSIIFLDLNMPHKSGHEVLKDIRSNPIFKEVPIVILSTANGAPIIEQCWEEGADLYMTKFSSLPVFVKALKHVINTDWKNRPRLRETFLFRP
ncbi:MAG: response regulator [Flavobacterium sp.]|nr:MAG: response regulator [Flavobacterium sp.]